MTRIRQALLGAFFVACVFAAGCLPSARAAQYTNQVTLSTTGYTDLGAGPLQIVAPAVGLVYVIVSDAQPSAGAVGDPIAGNSSIGRYVYNVTSHVWARSANSSVAIVVTAGLVGGGGSGGAVTDTNSAAFSTATAFTVGAGAVTAGRSVGVNCTSAGTVTFTMSGGGSYTVPIVVGYQTFPFAVTGATATTGTATYANLN